MNIKAFSDAQLVADTKRAVSEERQATLAVLDRLHEIYLRCVHLQLGFSSLHEFCVKELRYSDGAAFRRISAMRLCEDLPKARQAIAEGALSLSNAASLQNYFRKDEDACPTVEDKHELLAQIQGKSKSECERILYPEQTGRLVRFVADDETMQLLKRLSELTAIGEHDTAALIKRVSKVALRVLDPISTKKTTKTASPEKLACTGAKSTSRYIAVTVERGVWKRDGGQCTYVDPISKRRCTSRFGLQLDHVIPIALDGPSTSDNLRLFCRGHNLFAAERVFGREKMAGFRRLRNHSTPAKKESQPMPTLPTA